MTYIEYLEAVLAHIQKKPSVLCYTNYEVYIEIGCISHKRKLDTAIKILCKGNAHITSELRNIGYYMDVHKGQMYRQFIIKRLIGIEKLNGN